MFLTENTNTVKYDESKIDPAFLYEAVLEANDAYHDICMKMIKCEHVCIINEDAEMLVEAEGEAKRSFKEVVMNLLRKVKEALVNFKNFMVTQLTKLGKLITRVVSAPVRGVINIVGGIKAIRGVRKDLETIINTTDWEELMNIEFDDNLNEATEGEAGEATDAKQAVSEAKGVFDKLKAAVSKLNFFKASAEKAASESDEKEAHKKLSAVSAKISKCFSKIRNAFAVAFKAIWAAMKTAGKTVADKTKAAAGAVKAKVAKKPAAEEV